MWFFNSFVKSLYDLNWLRGTRKDLGKAFSYFCLFLFLYVGLTMVPVFVNMMKGDTVAALKTGLAQKVPDFTATVKDGELSVVGVDQPYIFRDGEFILVVDTITTSTLTLGTYLDDKINAGLLITRSKGEMYDGDKGQSRSQVWKDVGNVSVNRAQLINLANKFLSKPMMFVYFLFILVFVYMFLGVGKLLSVLIVSAIILAITKIAKKQWLFKEIFSGIIIFLIWLGVIVLLDKPAPVEEIKS